MYILFYITLLLLFIYGILIRYYDRCWKSIPVFKGDTAEETHLRISVIIPARNEAGNIAECLQAIKNQTYPVSQFEVIVIDDHSTDDTASAVRNFPMPNLKLSALADHVEGNRINSYKKKAIETAIALSEGELMVTTDADCVMGPRWLQTIAAFQRSRKASFIAAPVMIKPAQTLLSIFQSLDFVTLQGITGAAVHYRFHNMCNGANLAYLKNAFYQVDGFKGIDNIASGDDMLLMEKMASAFPDGVHFLKSAEAIVTTEAATSWRNFFNQRIRWASKSGSYKDRRISSVLLLVYLLNVFLLVFLFTGLFKPVWLLFFLMLTGIKILLEIGFTRRVAGFFNLKRLVPYFPFLQPLHMFYIMIAGWLGMFGSYEWKERKVK